MTTIPLLLYGLPDNDGSGSCHLGYIILNFFLIFLPPLYTGIYFIRPYQYRGTSKPYTLTSTVASVCVEHLFWCAMFNTLPFITPHPAVWTLQASMFHSLSPSRVFDNRHLTLDFLLFLLLGILIPPLLFLDKECVNSTRCFVERGSIFRIIHSCSNWHPPLQDNRDQHFQIFWIILHPKPTFHFTNSCLWLFVFSHELSPIVSYQPGHI